MVRQSGVNPGVDSIAMPATYGSLAVSEGPIVPSAGVFPPAPPANVPSCQTKEEGAGSGGGHVAAWKKDEVHEIPKNNLPVVFTGLFLAVFLAALDQTVVATALPTIVKDLGATGGYSWIGTAYLLTSASLSPIYGKLSDLTGRKPLLLGCVAIFLVGSALCGAAQSFTMLAVCRGVQGVGGGGIMQLVQISISDIVPLAERPKYMGALGSLWGISSVLGPLIGGLFTDHVTWRWAFWVNLPTGGIAMFLIFFLKLNPVESKPLSYHLKTIDFVGLFTIVSGVVLLLVGFNSSESSWGAAETIALLVIGCVLIILTVINEAYTTRQPIISPRLFKTRTTGALLMANFLHGFIYFSAAYYLPLYFQILGSSATMAGIRMLPFSFVMSTFSIGTGIVVARMGQYRPTIWFGFTVMTAGMGVMIILDDRTSTAGQELAILLAAVGIGCLFQPPLTAVQAAMPSKEMAIATSTFGFMRYLAGTIGISVGDAIYTSELRKRLGSIQGIETFIAGRDIQTVANNVKGLTHILPLEFRRKILHAYTKSVSTMWIVNTPISAVALLLALIIKEYTLASNVKRATVPADPDPNTSAAVSSIVKDDVEAQTVVPSMTHAVASTHNKEEQEEKFSEDSDVKEPTDFDEKPRV